MPAEDLIVPYSASDLNTAERVTHVVRMTENELRKLQVAGVYRDVDLQPGDEDDEGAIRQTGNELQGVRPSYGDDVYTLVECHTELDLEGFEDIDQTGEPTGVKLPYIVTMDEGSGQVLSVVRNYRQADPLRRKRQYFTHLSFCLGLAFMALVCFIL